MNTQHPAPGTTRLFCRPSQPSPALTAHSRSRSGAVSTHTLERTGFPARFAISSASALSRSPSAS